jgi:hypothetical protein
MTRQTDSFAAMISMATAMIVFAAILPIFLEMLSALSSNLAGAHAFESLITATQHFISVFVGLLKFAAGVGVGLLWLVILNGLYNGYRSSPYSLTDIGVQGRALLVEAIDLGDDDAECLTCGRDDGHGVRRGHVEELVLFGLPILTTGDSQTFDCIDCTDREGLRALDEEHDEDVLDLALDQSDDESDENAETDVATEMHPFATDEDGDDR